MCQSLEYSLALFMHLSKSFSIHKAALLSGHLPLLVICSPQPHPTLMLSTQTYLLFDLLPPTSASIYLVWWELAKWTLIECGWGSVSRLTYLSTTTKLCQISTLHFPRIKGKLVRADNSAGAVVSPAGGKWHCTVKINRGKVRYSMTGISIT